MEARVQRHRRLIKVQVYGLMGKKKTIFIDRDGVINKDPAGWTEYSYVTRLEDFKILPGALEALKILKDNGIDVIIVSNQSGVGKGYFSREELDAVNKKMLDMVKKAGGNIKDAYYCVHKTEDNCDCKKPKTGLFKQAIAKYDINITDSYFIGDDRRDIIAGKAIGIKTIFVLSGKFSRQELEGWGDKPDYIFKDLLNAVKWIIKREDK